MPWMAASGEAFGVTWLLEATAPASVFGRRARAAELAFRPGDEAAAAAASARVAAVAREQSEAQLAALRAAVAAAPDPGAAVVRAKNGGVLDDPDFFELSRFLEACGEIAAIAPALVEREPSEAATTLREALAVGRTPARSFYLDDAYASELAETRAQSAARQAAFDAARSRLAERAAAYAGVERLRDGEFVIMRERLEAPLPPEIRVLREAATYVLCELALDEPALAAAAALDEALARVAGAEEAVRVHLSGQVAVAAPALERACDDLGTLDVLVARAQFTQRFACVVPQIGPDVALVFEEARYLPLAQALASRGRSYTPISLAMDGVGVVTGPNMGGKSAALRTLGFVAACVALGVPVPARSAGVPLFDDVAWLGSEGAPSGEGLLSAFGTEVVGLRRFLRRSSGRALVLVDEFARTTSPREGRALLIALLQGLREREAIGLAATHLTGIAAAAGVAHYAIGGLGPLPPLAGDGLGLERALARIAEAMDYRLRRVPEDAVPAADAIALAEALGLDADLIDRARAAL